MACRIQMEKISAGDYRGPAIISFFFEKTTKLTPDQGSIDRRYKGIIVEALKSGHFRGEKSEICPLSLSGLRGVKRLLLIGLGKEEKFHSRDLKIAMAIGVQSLRAFGVGEIAAILLDPAESKLSIQEQVEKLTEGALLGAYQFDAYRSEKKDRPVALSSLTILAKDLPPIPIRDGIKWGEIVGTSINYARTLGNHPANVATPEFLAHEATEMAKHFASMQCRILNREDVAKLGMGAFLSVNQGSAENHPLKLIHLELRGRPARDSGRPSSKRTRKPPHPRIGLIGKGITFDSGGINLKTTQHIGDMKFDMCGGAAVLGVMRGLAEAQLPIDVVAMIPATENMPGQHATRPGDIVKSMSGITIEIANTDAEGRLILCDTITYMQQQKVNAIIDFATLTGAVMVALGDEASGLFSNHDGLAGQIEKAGESCGERVWRFPLWSEYEEKLKSEVADIKNIGGPYAGAITAACFLQKFINHTPWAHIDIAGTSSLEKKKSGMLAGATGVGVSLTLHWLRNYKDL